MIKAIFKDSSEKVLTGISASGTEGILDGNSYKWDILQVSKNNWSVIDENGESFHVVLENYSIDKNSYVLKIDGDEIEVKAQSEFDLLLKELGISSGGTKKLKEIKAPMPGLVLDVPVKEGDTVKEGDIVVILEAMKMENVIKATGDAQVKNIKVSNGDTIDKGSVMITFA